MTLTSEREEIDRIMGIVRGAEGWHIFGFGSDGEFHYVRNGVSLCGRWAYDGDTFQPHIAPRSNCAACIKGAGNAEGRSE